jgi:hypothetical protein
LKPARAIDDVPPGGSRVKVISTLGFPKPSGMRSINEPIGGPYSFWWKMSSITLIKFGEALSFDFRVLNEGREIARASESWLTPKGLIFKQTFVLAFDLYRSDELVASQEIAASIFPLDQKVSPGLR